MIDVGSVFERWTVIKVEYRNKKVTCRCECGTVKDVYRSNLTTGKTRSCGCLASELARERLKTMKADNEKLYNVYLSMKNRCYRENTKSYKDYGAKGVRVCSEWFASFDNFCKWSLKNGYKNGLTLDRINVFGNYEPSNCRFVDRFVQGRNKRNNRMVTINGETKTLSEWSEIIGIHHMTLSRRLDKGWSDDELFLKPDWKRREMKNEYISKVN